MIAVDAVPDPLVVREVVARYGERTVLHRVSLRLRPGEFLALTGPNGSGKTTLLRTILGLEAPVAGRVILAGRDVEAYSVRERARVVAWMPQQEELRENLRLDQYVLYGRHAHLPPFEGESDRDRAAADEALAAVDLRAKAARGILELSGGERQRAVLARVLAQATPILLLDEPTAHLDLGHQLDLLSRVRHLCRERGKSAIVALHDLNLAARFADRVVVLDRGRAVADGLPREVLRPELLLAVWGIVAEMKEDPRTQIPYLVPVLPPSSTLRVPAGLGRWIHVVGGGGSASPIVRHLVDEGYRLSVGVVPLLDSDTEVAESLHIPAVVELPFAPISPSTRARQRELLAAADAVVVAPFAVGPGNLANLEDVEPIVGQKPVVLVESTTTGRRDFTPDGAADRLLARLRARGAVTVANLPELTGALERRLGAASTGAPMTPGPREFV